MVGRFYYGALHGGGVQAEMCEYYLNGKMYAYLNAQYSSAMGVAPPTNDYFSIGMGTSSYNLTIKKPCVRIDNSTGTQTDIAENTVISGSYASADYTYVWY